jgi:hypothetical protein
MRPLSYPIKRNPRHVRAVTAVKSNRPSKPAIMIEESLEDVFDMVRGY